MSPKRRRYDSYFGGSGYYGPYFPPSRPRPVRGGIRSQSRRGKFGESWWARRWIAVLESFDIGARLGRGRSYARQGQVRSIEVKKGTVTAQVQGSRARPYDVVLKVRTIQAAAWKKLAKLLSARAVYAAKLLAGEMPEDIENAFRKARLSLFPARGSDLRSDCSCPDWSNPCKHIAAVYYLLGEEFDRDPFLIFKLRGLDRERMVALLGTAGAAATVPDSRPARGRKRPRARGEESGTLAAAPPAAAVAVETERLSADPSRFWGGAEPLDDLFGEVRVPPVQAALPRRLGNFPFWRGAVDLLETLEPIYEEAAGAGVAVYLCEPEQEPADEPAPSARRKARSASRRRPPQKSRT